MALCSRGSGRRWCPARWWGCGSHDVERHVSRPGRWPVRLGRADRPAGLVAVPKGFGTPRTNRSLMARGGSVESIRIPGATRDQRTALQMNAESPFATESVRRPRRLVERRVRVQLFLRYPVTEANSRHPASVGHLLRRRGPTAGDVDDRQSRWRRARGRRLREPMPDHPPAPVRLLAATGYDAERSALRRLRSRIIAVTAMPMSTFISIRATIGGPPRNLPSRSMNML